MANLTFKEVSDVINRTGATTIASKASVERRGAWAMYNAEVRSGERSFPFSVLYLLADIDREGFRSAGAELNKTGQPRGVQVVYAQSVEDRFSGELTKLRSLTGSCVSLESFFTSFIRQQTERYLSKVADLQHSHYVDPKITVPAGVQIKTPNPVLSLLSERDIGQSGREGALGVLLAEPGQGKTFMSKYLAASLARNKLLPIYVHSEQWLRMQADDLASLWKTIANSFRYFDAPIPWIEGAEQDFLRTSLKAGLFRIIFDGFDEYVLWNHGKVDPLETMQILRALASETGARILLTSRTSFWEAEIEETPGGVPKDIHVYRIEPFDQNHADNYFKARLSAHADKIRAASELFRELKARASGPASSGYVGRGFFLYHIADLVERGATGKLDDLNGKTVLQWTMEALCEREITRQKLPLSVAQQMNFLKEFAELIVRGDPPSTTTARFVLETTAELSERDIEELVGTHGRRSKLGDHPLIRRIPGKDEWMFVQEQTLYALLAEKIIELSDTSSGPQTLARLMAAPGLMAQTQSEIALAIVEQLCHQRPSGELEDRLLHVIGMLARCDQFDVERPALRNPSALASMIAIFANNREFPKGSDRREKTAGLVRLFPQARLNCLCFTGTLARYDFSSVEFSSCHFDQVVWTSSKFDASTTFDACHFAGGGVHGCEGFGLATWTDTCRLDGEARRYISAERTRAGKRKYAEADLRGDLAQLVRRFLPKDAAGFRTIEESNLKKGPLGISIHKDAVVDGFTKHILATHHISGGDRVGYHVREEAKDCLLHFSANGVMTGALAEVFSELKSKLRL